MPITRSTIKPLRYNTSGEAARREQKRLADLDREARNKQQPTIFVKKFGFRPEYSGHETLRMKGPLCPTSLSKDRQCLAPLSGDSAESIDARCDVCGSTHKLPHPFEEFRSIAKKAYEGLLNSQAELITLDVPYEAIKAKAEDDTRRIKIVWSQKDGRNQAIIYFIEKDGNTNGAKVHGFVDLDREEFRHDAADITPGKVLAAISAYFPNTEVQIKYGNKK